MHGPAYNPNLKALQPGNTLVLWKLDRLGHDLRHLVNTAEDLRARGTNRQRAARLRHLRRSPIMRSVRLCGAAWLWFRVGVQFTAGALRMITGYGPGLLGDAGRSEG